MPKVSVGSTCVEESESSQLLRMPSLERKVSSERNHQNGPPAADFNHKEISYAISAFYATLQPVAITLVLSSLAVVYIESPFSQLSADGGLSVYDISDGSDASINDSNTVKFGKSMINALVIVCAIALMTFVIVFLYWARCVRCIQGYMIFSSFMMLCLIGGIFLNSVVDQFQIRFDWISFSFLVYNFSVVGVIAIFFQEGVLPVVTQGYLICTSVLLVWQLSRFDEYTSFSLLLALAFYDLCAVLSPCGPLKALVVLMQERKVPLPGLLYEANLSRKSSFDGSNRTSRAGSSESMTSSCRNTRSPGNWLLRQPLDDENSPVEMGVISPKERMEPTTRLTPAVSNVTADCYHTVATTFHSDFVDVESKRCTDLGLIDGIRSVEINTAMSGGGDQMSSKSARLSLKYTSFPNGTRSSQSSSVSSPIEAQYRSQKEAEDCGLSKHHEGLDNDINADVDDDDSDSNSSSSTSSTPSGAHTSVKLGLGDFVFYSMLVSRAAVHGFPAFVATFFVVLGGLGVTLSLLAVYKKALPALPISILLGLIAYALTRFFLQPFLNCLNEAPLFI